MTVIMSEHRLDDALPIVDRVLMMSEGTIIFDGNPTAAAMFMMHEPRKHYQAYLPAPAKLFFALEEPIVKKIVPLNVKEGRSWFDPWMSHHSDQMIAPTSDKSKLRDPKSLAPFEDNQQSLIRMDEVTFRYAAEEPLVLNRLSLEVKCNEWLALLGGNASGKSTLLHMAAGLHKPLKGQIWINGNELKRMSSKQLYRTIGLLPQNPMSYFVCDTVQEELMLSAQRVEGSDATQLVRQMISKLMLESLLKRHPHDLSGGEQQKLALGCVLLGQPRILLLDEPTKGLDPDSKRQLVMMLRALHQEGLTLLMVTHDVEFAAATATRCTLLFDGEVASSGTPSEFFSQNYFYTTSINRMVRHHLPEALIEEDVIRLWR